VSARLGDHRSYREYTKSALPDPHDRFGSPAYARIDAPATREEKVVLAALRPEQVTASELGASRSLPS